MSDEEFEEKLRTIDERKIKHVLYLSNFIKSKGYPEVLEMAKLEKERCESGEERKFHFDFAGKFFEENEKDFFFSYIKENNLDDYVTYHGVVGGDKKRELLKKCDIFALLTRYPKEGQPISILEAMGNGMVVVTTDHAGIPDIVNRQVNVVCNCKNDIDFDLNKLTITGEVMLFNRNKVTKYYCEKRYLEDLNNVFRES
jgi:glycosyltransferase involved in cell wall biosynthesis